METDLTDEEDEDERMDESSGGQVAHGGEEMIEFPIERKEVGAGRGERRERSDIIAWLREIIAIVAVLLLLAYALLRLIPAILSGENGELMDRLGKVVSVVDKLSPQRLVNTSK